MSARFEVGQSVRIGDRTEPRHHRVPAYVKGREGIVVCLCHPQGLPEELAYREPGEPKQTVYRVRLGQPQLWTCYQGEAHDNLEIEIHESWLDPV